MKMVSSLSTIWQNGNLKREAGSFGLRLISHASHRCVWLESRTTCDTFISSRALR